MIRRPPRSTLSSSSAASDVYKRQEGWFASEVELGGLVCCQGEGCDLRERNATITAWMVTAAQRMPEAARMLGVWFKEGWSGSGQEDLKQAYEWTRRGAEQGDGEAECNLSAFFENGWHVPQDLDRAAALSARAGEKGSFYRYTQCSGLALRDDSRPEVLALIEGALLRQSLSLRGHRHQNSDKNDRVAVLVEPRKHWLLEAVVRNAMEFLLSLIHISEPTRLLSISYAVFCLKKKKKKH
eukprot:TRINITY_DN17714_c0_g1_i1.p1 TRINITY_DN17714_c0_g1~~TRINITY_DN17714_c0_g1_i1.p1  ORF type:complete len:240 (-),score=74.19 TRINITY_DN17714_c0_g1_i1:59-778(-)